VWRTLFAAALILACLVMVRAQKQAGEFAVNGAGLKVDEAKLSGECPVTVKFTGYITTNGPGTVKYTFNMDAIARAFPTIRSAVAHLLSDPSLTPYDFHPMLGVAFGLDRTVTLDERVLNTQDRPLGMVRLVSSPERLSFQPQVLVLTYEGARNAIARDNGFGPGVVQVRYDDQRELEGSYSLYLKVERVR